MSLHEGMTRNGLVRPIDDRVFGGVCAGLGRRFGLEPWPARLLFVLVLMLLPGSQLLVYPILWILMPSEVRYDAAAYPAGAYPGQPYPATGYAAQGYAAPQGYAQPPAPQT